MLALFSRRALSQESGFLGVCINKGDLNNGIQRKHLYKKTKKKTKKNFYKHFDRTSKRELSLKLKQKYTIKKKKRKKMSFKCFSESKINNKREICSVSYGHNLKKINITWSQCVVLRRFLSRTFGTNAKRSQKETKILLVLLDHWTAKTLRVFSPNFSVCISTFLDAKPARSSRTVAVWILRPNVFS